jgi:surfactin synthase thioesterase subunit
MPAREELADVTFHGDLNQMASLLARQIEAERNQQDSDDPFVLIGHSYGGILAYRVASDLSARGIIPHRLVVLSSPAPDRPSHDGPLHCLSDEALVQQVDALFGGVPQSILDDAAAHRFLVPGLRFDLGLLEGYEHVPADPLSVPIVAVCGMDDRAVSVAQMQGWRRFTSDRFQLRLMPGDHFFALARMPEILRIALWDVLPG